MDTKEKKVVIGIIGTVLLIFAGSILIYNQALSQLAEKSCTDIADECPHKKLVETQNAIIIALLLILGTLVLWVIYYLRKEESDGKTDQKIHTVEKKSEHKESINLDEDEKKVLELIDGASGSIFQSELNRRLGYTKVKVSRILDRLEQKGIVERKRRGMANLVIRK